VSKNIEQRSAEALVATFVQMSRSAELARSLQRLRQRTLENRVRKTTDARELVKLHMRLEAQQSQAAVLDAATDRFRYQAPNLAQFSKAGLTMEDFRRLGVAHVIEPSRLEAEIERVKQGVSVPVPDLTPGQRARREAEAGGGAGAKRGKGRGRAAKATKAAKTPAPPPTIPAAEAASGEKAHAPHAAAAHHRGAAHPARKRTPRKRSHHRKDED
jgi:hypothetical protein